MMLQQGLRRDPIACFASGNILFIAKAKNSPQGLIGALWAMCVY